MAEPVVLYAIMTKDFKAYRIEKSLLIAKRYASKRRHSIIGRMVDYGVVDHLYRMIPTYDPRASEYDVKKFRRGWIEETLSSSIQVRISRGQKRAFETFKHKE